MPDPIYIHLEALEAFVSQRDDAEIARIFRDLRDRWAAEDWASLLELPFIYLAIPEDA